MFIVKKASYFNLLHVMKVLHHIFIVSTCLVLNSSIITLNAQEIKRLEAVKTNQVFKIDGKLSEEAWNIVPYISDFITYSPTIGKPAKNKTKVKILYSDKALYIGAELSYQDPAVIPTGLCGRDEISMNADYFHVTLSPFNDGHNMYEFIVSSANVQVDQKLKSHQIENYHADEQTHGSSEEDQSVDKEWDAVWDSEVIYTDSGWNVEIRIPYSAIRFPKKELMNWGLNFWRIDRSNKETSTWNLVDRSKNGIANQQGELSNLKNINSPIRLELRPYVSGYSEKYSEKEGLDYSLNGGLDLKYGINESFTLDMMLIPDFGQTTSDNIVLNLTAHETKYSEKRQFFTEGTELFEKAGLFYSRRIGAIPSGYENVDEQLSEGEKIKSNPSETRIVNATKISGRTPDGLGLGFFYAITKNTYAIIEDSVNNERKIKTEPLSHYNIIVADKAFGKYSYLNIINLHKYVPQNKYSSNVTGTAFKFANKNNTYGIYGTGALSLISMAETTTDKSIGEYMNLSLGKISGSFQYNYNVELISDEFESNDMGYFTLKNELNHTGVLKYSMFRPKGKFLTFNSSLQSTYKSLFTTNEFTEGKFLLSLNGMLKNFYTVGGDVNLKPWGVKDYYEPRVNGWYMQRPASHKLSFFIVSDMRKVFTWNTRFSYKKEMGKEFYFGITPGLRLNDKLSFNYSVDAWKTNGDMGFVEIIGADSILFAERIVEGISQSISGQYSFNNKSFLNLKIRYYQSYVDYNSFFLLNRQGGTDPYSTFVPDFSFSVFSIDFIYSWNFAPGSFLTLMWKNNSLAAGPVFNDTFDRFFDSLHNTITGPQTNSFSVKVSYYLDYHRLFK